MFPDIQPKDLGCWISHFKKKLDDHIADFNDRSEYFAEFYRLLIDVEYGVKERTELLQFLKSILHNEQFFLDDGINIRLGKDLTCKYSFLRKLLYLSLFAMIGTEEGGQKKGTAQKERPDCQKKEEQKRRVDEFWAIFLTISFFNTIITGVTVRKKCRQSACFLE